MARLFVSYRREDSAGFAGRLTDALESIYGEGSVFRDVDDIPPGEDFAQVIQRGLDQVAAVLVVIGPGWLESSSAGQRRLDHEDDFVRREIEGALALRKPLLPVLVGGATMPAAEALPAPIRPLAARQALALRDASWRSDIGALQAALQPLLDAGANRAGRLADEARAAALPAARVRRRHLLALGVALAAGIVALLFAGRIDEPPAVVALDGAWVGRVEYPWGVALDERFELAIRDGIVSGSASFLGVPRSIESGEVRDGQLQFITRSTEVAGDAPPRELVHRYVGERAEGGIRFTLDSRGGISPSPAVHFVLRRH